MVPDSVHCSCVWVVDLLPDVEGGRGLDGVPVLARKRIRPLLQALLAL